MENRIYDRNAAASRNDLLVEKLPLPYSRQDLLVPPELAAQLEAAITAARPRVQVREALSDWLPWQKLPGQCLLFSGPPGTGKTMAAQVLARELDVELDRVDLSRTVGKYIGDTEKSLAALFGHQRSSVLLLDHLDAMFEDARRLSGGSPNPSILNWLLQSLEDRDGLTVVTCRTTRHIDAAFVRRCQVVVNFALPTPLHRLMIWDRALPPAVPRNADVDLGVLAERFELSGGEIRESAVKAVLRAEFEGVAVAMDHLTSAAQRIAGLSTGPRRPSVQGSTS